MRTSTSNHSIESWLIRTLLKNIIIEVKLKCLQDGIFDVHLSLKYRYGVVENMTLTWFFLSKSEPLHTCNRESSIAMAD